MTAAKCVDCIAHLSGNNGEDSDAVGAYKQVLLSWMRTRGHTIRTWVTLSRHLWPASWNNIESPVIELLINLYGHPLAGLHWEIFSTEVILKAGFEKVPGWECLFVHKELQVFLNVYVDDFKMAGDTKTMATAWKKLQEHLDLEPPVPSSSNTYLGCKSHITTPSDIAVQEKSDLFEAIKPTAGSTDPANCSEMTIPDEELGNLAAEAHAHAAKSDQRATVSGFSYEMKGQAEGTVDKYLELAKKTKADLKPVSTPCMDDHQLAPEDFEEKGTLQPVCAKIVLKALYMARITRMDILWTVNQLARDVTRWNVACDKRLYRLICYVHTHGSYKQDCWVGDAPENILVAPFSDASFAGDLKDSRSTSGSFTASVGPRTWVPIAWACKKQGAVSHSSTEAEVIALETCIRGEGIPVVSLWDIVIRVFNPQDREAPLVTQDQKDQQKQDDLMQTLDETLDPKVLRQLLTVDEVPFTSIVQARGRAKLVVMEDNEAVIKMIIKGRSPNMRHVSRTHRVNLDWLFFYISCDPNTTIKYVNTKNQIADILTKGSFPPWRGKTCYLSPPSLR